MNASYSMKQIFYFISYSINYLEHKINMKKLYYPHIIISKIIQYSNEYCYEGNNLFIYIFKKKFKIKQIN